MILSPWKLLDPLQMRDATGAPMGTDRPAGVHVGDTVRIARQEADLPQGTPEGEQEGVRMQIGFLHEAAVEYMLAGMPFDAAYDLAFKRYMLPLRSAEATCRQIRLEKDRVHGTPDALIVEGGYLDSYKATHKSMRKAVRDTLLIADFKQDLEADQDFFEEHFWPWLMGEMAYCFMACVDTVRFYVLWQMGDYSYRPGWGPQVRYMDATFTPEELVANWRRVIAYRDMIEARNAVSG